jgi:hypothetical protein
LEDVVVSVTVVRVIRRCRDNTRFVVVGPGGILGSVKFPSDSTIGEGTAIDVPFAGLNSWPLP